MIVLNKRMLRGGMVPALVDQVLKGHCILRREQRSQRLCILSQPFCFGRRYIIVLKLSVREIEREATMKKSTPIIYLIISYLKRVFSYPTNRIIGY